GRERPRVHAPRHAGINPVLDGHLRPRAGAVVGKRSQQPEQRDAELLRSGVEVAIAASEIVAGKALGAIRNLRTDMGVGRRDEVAPAPHQAAMGIVRELAALGHGPDSAGWTSLLARNSSALRVPRAIPIATRTPARPSG